MEQSVYGVYDSAKEASDAINKLKERGFQENVFTVIAKNEEDINFLNADDTPQMNVVAAHSDEKDSFLDKAMRYFMDIEDQLDEHLMNNGASKGEANRYVEDVEAGKIIVLVEKKKS
ncbi:general stress protein [Peribacillus kribbensis]|uniref:general stress protein n=1 Tax=Peribacillus kribbensis TaxID=356658 RepID=UPI0003F7083B|nr:general stress protein [Peribacillus kribbensis]